MTALQSPYGDETNERMAEYSLLLSEHVTLGIAPERVVQIAHAPANVWEAIYPAGTLDVHTWQCYRDRLAGKLGWGLRSKGNRLTRNGWKDVLQFDV